eukprot:SAG31_NODE_3739_length_3932_cov_3.343245_4_plen_245_part_00
MVRFIAATQQEGPTIDGFQAFLQASTSVSSCGEPEAAKAENLAPSLSNTDGPELQVSIGDIKSDAEEPQAVVYVDKTINEDAAQNEDVGSRTDSQLLLPEPCIGQCPPHVLVEDLHKLLRPENADICDVTFVVGRMRQRLPALRGILAVRSSFFRDLLYGDHRNDKIINLPDCPAEPFRRLLEYGHTGSTQLDAKHVIDLMMLADQFELPELKEMCGQVCMPNWWFQIFALFVLHDYSPWSLEM